MKTVVATPLARYGNMARCKNSRYTGNSTVSCNQTADFYMHLHIRKIYIFKMEKRKMHRMHLMQDAKEYKITKVQYCIKCIINLIEKAIFYLDNFLFSKFYL